tara:strand:+ start:612 stop:1127 length:516 start_codon:yes stop_codon:yes gene_type:complete
MDDDFDLTNLKKSSTKKINSRRKGNTFTRKICKIFNERFNTKEFCTTPGSGAFATTHTLPDYLKIYGDIITPINFKYCIECKKGYNKENLNSILNYSSEFWKFVKQSSRDAEKSKKFPLLIIQQDRKPVLAILKRIHAPALDSSCDFGEYRMCLFEDLLLEKSNFWFTKDS